MFQSLSGRKAGAFSQNVMMTGAFSRNIGKLFSKLKLVTDNLPTNWEATETWSPARGDSADIYSCLQKGDFVHEYTHKLSWRVKEEVTMLFWQEVLIREIL